MQLYRETPYFSYSAQPTYASLHPSVRGVDELRRPMNDGCLSIQQTGVDQMIDQ